MGSVTRDKVSVLIAGAGLQGSCIALELARRGFRVLLMDQDEQPMNRASLRNEGKIHLGMVYANDPTLETARLQLSGALRFRRLLERWIGASANQLRTSTPFSYVVAHDSVLGPDALEDFYARLNQEYREQCLADPELDYLGTHPETLAQRLDTIPREFARDSLQAVFATVELAIDPAQLADVIRSALLASPLIDFCGGHRVRNIERSGDLLRVEGDGPDGAFEVSASQVVNATWEGRAVLDRGMGLAPPPGLLHRLKYRVLVRVPAAMQRGPSVTMVLGRYGDVVIRPEGLTFLSWYPAGLRGWTNDIEPSPAWDEPCRGNSPPDLAREISELTLRGIDEWYPGIASSRVAVVDAGAIVARGRTDVDDAKSGLHDRTCVGVTSVDNYHTVDPGKLTTAPLFALQAAERVALRAGRPGASAAFAGVSLNSEPTSLPRVVALLPAWRAAAFIQETLDSLAAQTYPNLHILISDDASPDNTAELCDAFAARRENTRVIRQPKNLGWIGNVNALLGEASGDFFFYAFHDDLVKPTYVERLVAAFEDNPRAVVSFSDMETHHLDGRIETQKYASLDGIKRGYCRAQRIIGAEGHWWVPNRGLFRASVAREIGGMKGHLGGDFAADWLWLLRLVLAGEFVRVPEVLVVKRYMKQSVSVLWRHNNPWNHFALVVACLLTLRKAGLPLGEELRLQVRAIRFAGAKLHHFAQHIGRKLLRPRSAIGIMLGITSQLE